MPALADRPHCYSTRLALQLRVSALLFFIGVALVLPSIALAATPVSFTKNYMVNWWYGLVAFDAFKAELPAGASREATLTVTKTNAKSLWTGALLFNGRVVPIGDALRGVPFEVKVTLDPTNHIALALAGTPGAGLTIAVKGANVAPTATLTADPASLLCGDPTTLSWATTNATSASIAANVGTSPGAVSLQGATQLTPLVSTLYTLTATGSGGSTIANAQVAVTCPQPLVSIAANPASINEGESTTLTWTSQYGRSARLEQVGGGLAQDVALNGNLSVSPMDSTSYVLTVTSPAGQSAAQAAVAVIHPAPTAELSVSPTSILAGEQATLSWSTTRATTVSIDGVGANLAASGSSAVNPGRTTTYTLTASGPGGTTTAQATLTVRAPAAPQPTNSFGKSYEELIPPDSTLKEYEPRRFALVTGLVQDEFGAAVANARVTVHGRPEYGSALTDAAGRFSMPVLGGGSVSVVYEKPGFITSTRAVEIGWNDVATAETVALVRRDAKATTVVFDGNPATLQAHTSSPVSDAPGTRSATLLLRGDTRASEVDANGNVLRELPEITVRASEFRTPASMPAPLPPQSAFTYCVELEADGVARTKFDKPVPVYVDNFLGFEVGLIVPVGYFDRDKNQWIAEPNGRVIKLIDTDNDGKADAVESTSSGSPLPAISVQADELALLAEKYAPGMTLWRFEVTHFSPWDANYGMAPPPGATPPTPPDNPRAEPERPKKPPCDPSDPCCKDQPNTPVGSWIVHKTGVFQDDFALPGADDKLFYASDRTPGYARKVYVPASGATVPSVLKRIDVIFEVAGRRFTQQLEPRPNQAAQFVWDGFDYLGRRVSPKTGRVTIGYVYDMTYTRPNMSFDRAFAQIGNDYTAVRGRIETTSWLRSDVELTGADLPRDEIAQGWTLTDHHRMDPVSSDVLHKGDGTTLVNQSLMINRVVGAGTGPWSSGTYPDWWYEGPALEGRISVNGGIAVDKAGNLYVADWNSGRVRVVDKSGYARIVANNNTYNKPACYGLDGPALDASFNNISAITVDNAGNIYLGRSYDGRPDYSRIYKIDTAGIIRHFAGTGEWASSGDNGPAKDASIQVGTGQVLATDGAGNLYLTQGASHRIRKISPDGVITTIAGTGAAGYSGDGGPARDAKLNYPAALVADSEGNIYFCDTSNHVIRKIDKSGIITTIAGIKNSGYSGDGGPAKDAQIWQPYAISRDAIGNLYFLAAVPFKPWVIRKIDTAGSISTIAGGNNTVDGSGDGGPATQANISFYYHMVCGPQGELYTIGQQRYVRKISTPGNFATKTTAGDFTFADPNGQGYIIGANGLHKSTIDLATGVTLKTFGYDSANRLVSITDRFGQITSVERDGSGKATAIVAPNGTRTTLTVDASNHLTAIGLADGATTAFEYDAKGLLTAKTDARGNRFEHVFDADGRVTDATDPEGGHWTLKSWQGVASRITEVRSAEGDLTRYEDSERASGSYSVVTDPAGGVSNTTLSADGLTSVRTLSCGMSIGETYGLDPLYYTRYTTLQRQATPAGLVRISEFARSYTDTNSDTKKDRITETSKVNGRISTLVTETLTGGLTYTSASSRVVTSNYDPVTLLTSTLNVPGLHPTRFAYDTKGRLTSISQGDATTSRTASYAYDAKDNLASVTDPTGKTTSFEYDAVGRRTAIHRPDGTNIAFTYDANGNMTVLTTPSTAAHAFGYSKTNLNNAYDTPLANHYRYVYDRDKRLTSTVFPSGKTITNTYANGKLTQTSTPEGDILYNYLCASKLGSITKGGESISYTYDASLLMSETSAGTLTQTLAYVYDNDFRLSRFTYAGAATDYAYDADSLLVKAGAYAITRNAANGLPETVSDTATGGVLNIARSFNAFGEQDAQAYTVAGATPFSWNVTRDAAGRITRKTETTPTNTIVYDYTYDNLGRLLTVKANDSLVEEYRYNAQGARVYEMNARRGIAGRNYAYSIEDHLLQAGDATYQYDADGFLRTKAVSGQTTLYNYSSRGELLRVDLPDGRVIEYINDPQGRRIAKKINGAIVEKYLWQGLTRLLAIYDANNALRYRYEYADDRTPVAVMTAGQKYQMHYDQVGTLRAVTDAAGNVVKEMAYDSFGNVLSDTRPGMSHFAFASGLYDADTGLVRFGYRDYDANAGVWTAKDPIGFSGNDVLLYSYIGNDPSNFIDPLGLEGNNIKYWLEMYHGYELVAKGFAIMVIPIVESGGNPVAIGAGVVLGCGFMGYGYYLIYNANRHPGEPDAPIQPIRVPPKPSLLPPTPRDHPLPRPEQPIIPEPSRPTKPRSSEPC